MEHQLGVFERAFAHIWFPMREPLMATGSLPEKLDDLGKDVLAFHENAMALRLATTKTVDDEIRDLATRLRELTFEIIKIRPLDTESPEEFAQRLTHLVGTERRELRRQLLDAIGDSIRRNR